MIISIGEISNKLKENEGWKYNNNKIEKVFIFESFNFIIDEIIAKIKIISTEINHHPDFKVYNYKKLKIILTTHKFGGVTELDFLFLEKFEEYLKNIPHNIEYE